ncbi:MAG TPA: hypothetical protein VMU49_03120 [Candidatus Acidoferrales bacterium]|nr:hypothetical protein [Candidatus Acidoferrales bacterium]
MPLIHRLAGFLGLFVALLLLLALRVADAPTGAGLRAALAPSAQRSALLAAEGRGLLRISPLGAVARVGRLPAGRPLDLASSGPLVLLGTDQGLQLSVDSGHTWRRVREGQFMAVAAAGAQLWAGQWGGALWHSRDGGRSWSVDSFPEAKPEFESIAADAQGGAAAGTLLGLYQRVGSNWHRVSSVGDRVTAVSTRTGGFEAADWRGRIWRSRGGDWRLWNTVHAGVWAVTQDAMGTTSGLVVNGHSVPALGGHEVTSLVRSGGALFAFAAPNRVFASTDSGGHWRLVFEGQAA